MHIRTALAALSAALAASALLALPAQAADRIKIGFLSTLTGPISGISADLKDGFDLVVSRNGGKLGGLPAELVVGDDQQNPDTGKQVFDRMVKRDKVDVLTGVMFTNVMAAVAPTAFANKVFFVNANAGPADFAGDKCNPYYFGTAWQVESMDEAMGKYVTEKGYKRVFLLAPNFPVGREHLNGFKRMYKEPLAGEVYTKLGQLDYSVEIGQIRAAKPDAVFVFLFGNMGINFIKQYHQAGLSSEVPLFGPGFTFDDDTIRAVGDPIVGSLNASHWNRDFDNPANRRFVAEFEKAYKRPPSIYAAQGYDAAQLIDAAVRDAGGRIEDKTAFRDALRKANFESVRGSFAFNANQNPVQNLYLRRIEKDAAGRISNRTERVLLANHHDPYADQCRMK